MTDSQNVTVNDHLALELGRKELANLVLRAQLEAAQARIRELEGEKADADGENVERLEPAVT